MSAYIYSTLVYAHLLLFVLWLGADAGVFMLGQHFRKRHLYSLSERVVLLKLLVALDMAPRTSWALMVPVSLTLAMAGGLLQAPAAVVAVSWILGGMWLWLVWYAHLHDQTPQAQRARRAEFWIKIIIMVGYFAVGASSLVIGKPLAAGWLAWKALLFAAIFAAAIMIDVRFRPVGAQLARLLAEGSSDATEVPLRRTMDQARIWVFAVYGLLIIISWLGVAKPF